MFPYMSTLILPHIQADLSENSFTKVFYLNNSSNKTSIFCKKGINLYVYIILKRQKEI